MKSSALSTVNRNSTLKKQESLYFEESNSIKGSVSYNEKKLTHIFNGDTNGLFYYLGTKKYASSYGNPNTRFCNVWRSSDLMDGGATYLTSGSLLLDRSGSNQDALTNNNPDEFIAMDIGAERLLSVDTYTFKQRYYNGGSIDLPRNWKLQGTNTLLGTSKQLVNLSAWEDIDVQLNNTSISGDGQWYTGKIRPSRNYRYFRFLYCGPNSEGRFYMTFCEVELYGTLKAPIVKNADVNTAILVNGESNFVDHSLTDCVVEPVNLAIDPTNYKVGKGSIYNNASGYLKLSAGTWNNFGSSDFTVEFMFKTTATAQYATLISKSSVAFSAGMWTILMNNYNNGGDITIYFGGYGGVFLSSGSGYNNNVWHHLAWTRKGNVFYLFVDGVLKNSVTFTFTIPDIAGDIYLFKDEMYARNLQGYINQIRISKGLCRYSASFTPPSLPFSN